MTTPRPKDLKKLLADRWPEAAADTERRADRIFHTGLADFDRLFPLGGLPYGQLIEISGEASSGKTGFLIAVLAGLRRAYPGARPERIAYIDFGSTFFPQAAAAGGITMDRLVVVRPDDLARGVRAAEQLLDKRAAGCLVFDLVGQTRPLPISLMHRLRARTVRARGVIFFLTEGNSGLIPLSMASLRLEVVRRDDDVLNVTTIKSRISPPGAHLEVKLHE
jgi:hypothetical protein